MVRPLRAWHPLLPTMTPKTWFHAAVDRAFAAPTRVAGDRNGKGASDASRRRAARR